MSTPNQPYRPSYGPGAQQPSAGPPVEYRQPHPYQLQQPQQFLPEQPPGYASPSAPAQAPGQPAAEDDPGETLKAGAYLLGGIGTITGFVWRAMLDKDPNWVGLVAILFLGAAVLLYFAGYLVSKSRK